MIYFIFKKNCSIFHITGDIFVGAHRFGVPFPKLKTFSEIFWALPIEYSRYEKTTLGILIYLFIYKVTTTKANFRFYKQRSESYLRTSHFCAKCQYRFLALTFLYTLKKIPSKNLVKFWKWNLKTYTPVGLKFVFEKIKLKVLHYLQHELFVNAQDSVKIRSKFLLLTISALSTLTHSKGRYTSA